MLKHVTRFAAAAIAVAGFSAAAAAQDKVTIGVPNWPSVNITANVIKIIAEENFGTEVELVPGTNAVNRCVYFLDPDDIPMELSQPVRESSKEIN